MSQTSGGALTHMRQPHLMNAFSKLESDFISDITSENSLGR